MTTQTRIFFKIYQFVESIKHSVLISAFGYHSVCKHRPTCSQYTLNQMHKNGTITGLWMGLQRVARCW